jgi:hypothetical protein
MELEAEQLWQELEAAMAAYGELVEDLEAQRIDAATFRRRALRTGLVLHDDGAWILDLVNQRWCRYDGLEVVPVPLEAR